MFVFYVLIHPYQAIASYVAIHFALISLYVTGFMKTNPNRTKTEIFFIA